MADYTEDSREYELKELLSVAGDEDGDLATIVETELFQTSCDEDSRREKMMAEAENAFSLAAPAPKYAAEGLS